MNNIIALVGFIGSGKDTVGQYLVERHGYTAISFAQALKDALAAIFLWDRDMLEGRTPESRAWREQIDPWWAEKLGIPAFSPRFAMQNIGTDVMRRHFNPDIWTLNVARRLSSMTGPVVVTDARFRNELDLCRSFGATVTWVRRGSLPIWHDDAVRANKGDTESEQRLRSMNIHESEWRWVGYPVDTIIYNDYDIDDLYEATSRCVGR